MGVIAVADWVSALWQQMEEVVKPRSDETLAAWVDARCSTLWCLTCMAQAVVYSRPLLLSSWPLLSLVGVASPILELLKTALSKSWLPSLRCNPVFSVEAQRWKDL